MKRIILLALLLTTVASAAPVRIFYWIGPRGKMLKTMTSNPRHIALMEAWMTKKCKKEKPVRKAYTTEEWKKLKLEERQKTKTLKIKRNKVTDPNTGTTTGDDMEYTVLHKSPVKHFNMDPNDVVDENEVK